MKGQDLSRFALPDGFRGRGAVQVQLWWLVQATLFQCSPQFAYGFRAWLLRLFGAQVGKKTVIRPSVRVTYPWKVKIGDYAWIGDQVELYSLGEIEIGAHAVVSQRSYLCTGSHDSASRSFRIYAKPIVVEDGAWIATDVFVAPGVTVGSNALIGARSSLFTNAKSGWVYVGTPAKPVRERVFEPEAFE